MANKTALLAKLLAEKHRRTHRSPPPLNLAAAFADNAAQHPQTPLVIGHSSLTYAALNTYSKQLAGYLQALGVTTETTVGLCLTPGVDAIASLFALLNIGADWLFLDPDSPQAYLQQRLNTANITLVLSQHPATTHLPEANVQCVFLDAQASQIQQHPATFSAHTAPKQNAHHSRDIQWLQQTFPLTPDDTVLCHTPLTEPWAVYEYLWPLCVGSRLHVSATQDPNKLFEVIHAHHISVLFVPSPNLTRAIKNLTTDTAKTLRWVFSTGEPLAQNTANALLQTCACTLQSIYLPLGVPGITATYTAKVEQKHTCLPLGAPIHHRVQVLDQALTPTPIGLKGHIYVTQADTTLHFTGDHGRWLSNGQLEWLGSQHRQTLIHNQRVYLSSVESTLQQHPLINECRLLARLSTTGETLLMAYVTLSGPFSAARLHAFMQQQLPPPMRPSAYLAVPQLPLTREGDIDDQRLRQCPVTDDDLLARWQNTLSAHPEIQQAAVMLQPRNVSLPPLHLSDVLPEYHPATTQHQAIQPPTAAAAVAQIPAISHGHADICVPESASTLSAVLQRAAQQFPHHGVTYLPFSGTATHQTYPALLADAETILAGLRQLGLQAQDPVIFQVTQTADFFPAFWACILGGFVPVPIAVAASYTHTNHAVDKLYRVWSMLDQPLMLSDAELIPQIHHSATLYEIDALQLADIEHLRHYAPDHTWHAASPEDLSLLLLTSGSTGTPKAVMQTHGTLLQRSASAAHTLALSAADISLNWLPVEHVVGLVMFHLQDVYLGSDQIHAPTQRVLENPLRWLDWIEQYHVSVTWAPNFAFALANEHIEAHPERHWDLSCVRYVLNAGEVVVAKTVRRFLQLLGPHDLATTSVYPAWGMTETASAVTYAPFSLDETHDDDVFINLGKPISCFSMRIVDDQQHLLMEGEVGHLEVKGNAVTPGYWHNPDANAAAFSQDGWFDTGDLGYLQAGSLVLTGRAKDLIIIHGIHYYNHEIETIVAETPAVNASYVAACAVRSDNSQSDELGIFFNTDISAGDTLVALIEAIRQRVIHAIGLNPHYLLPVDKSAIPKTDIGKIQRTQLVARFAAGAFTHTLKQLDLLTHNENTLPDWFYRIIWRQKQIQTPPSQSLSGTCLLFADALGLTQAMQHQYAHSILIEAGSSWVQHTPEHYQLHPERPEHYQRLFATLHANGVRVQHIIHAWTYTPPTPEPDLEQTHALGFNSLLFLAQALPQVPDDSSMNLYVISSGSQSLTSDDTLAYAKTPLFGLIAALPNEMPGLRCRHIDLPTQHPSTYASTLLHELADLSTQPEVAYRHHKRWIPRLQKHTVEAPTSTNTHFTHGGFYLISGGLGGLGQVICEYLLQHYAAKLLIIGRTPLDASNPHHADRVYQSLLALPGKVHYQALDIGDAPSLQTAVQQLSTEWQLELAGIVHLAGTYQECTVAAETPASVAAILHPKIQGTLALQRLIKPQSNFLFIHFSSISAYFGGATLCAYTAASRFQQAFSQYQRDQGIRSYCFNWSTWADLGINAKRSGSHSKGYCRLSKTQGVSTLRVGLQHAPATFMLGIDPNNAQMRSHIEGQTDPGSTLVAYTCLTADTVVPATLKTLVLNDRFNTESHCQIVPLKHMPLLDNGAIDQPALAALQHTSASKQQHVPANTDTEKQLVKIWQHLLGLTTIGIEDNFFALGGHSLLAGQLIHHIHSHFGVTLLLHRIFQQPTIQGLAEHIAQASPEATQTLPPIQPRAPSTQPVPLSFAQQRLWFHQQLLPDSQAYNYTVSVPLSGPLKHDVFSRCVNQVIQRHEILRTNFVLQAGQPSQHIHATRHLDIPLISLQTLSPTEQNAALAQHITHAAKHRFDLSCDVLLRIRLIQLGDDRHMLLFSTQHIIFDGASIPVLLNEIARLYETLQLNAPSDLPALSIQYADFAQWQRDWMHSEDADKQRRYWLKQLKHAPETINLPTDRARLPNNTFSGQQHTFHLSPELSQALKHLSQNQNASLFMTLLAVFAVLLSRYSQQDDLVIASPVANRHHPALAPLIGFFANTLALRIDLSTDLNFTQLLDHVKQVTLAGYAHQDLPFDALVEALQPSRHLNRLPLTQIAFAVHNTPSKRSLAGLEMGELCFAQGAARFDLECQIELSEGHIKGHLIYNTALFEASTVARMLQHYQVLLDRVCTHPTLALSTLSLLTADERETILVAWNKTRTDYPKQCIHHAFETCVEQQPDAIALVLADTQLSYEQLNQRANQLADYLQQHGVGLGTLVGLYLPRSTDLLAALLAILKVGGTYVALDLTAPPERLLTLLQDAHIRTVFTLADTAHLFTDAIPNVMTIEPLALAHYSSANPTTAELTPEHLAYVSFTSGTSGQPKGICIRHKSVLRLVKNTDFVDYAPDQVFLHMAPLAFDASTFEIWGSLLNGSTLVIMPPGVFSPSDIGRLIGAHQVTTLWLTAGLFHLMVEQQLAALSPVRQLLAGGDILSVPHVRKALKTLKHCRLINGYGPTENTTFTCCWTVDETQIGRTVPIGTPIANTQVYILDAHCQPVPIGVPGELCTAGEGLAQGYLNDAALSAEKFIPHPFSTETGARLYRTGDLARYRPDGTIEYLGRADRQIKRRGFRIELAEIDRALMQHPSVQQAVAILRQDAPGEQQLTAYAVLHPASDTRQDALQTFLRNKLPPYMLPSALVILPAFALTPNGKLDQQALPAPTAPAALRLAPNNATEQRIATIWQKLLPTQTLGYEQNFFDLGGHSLLLAQAHQHLEAAFEQELSMLELFEHPTIASLAQHLMRSEQTAPDQGPTRASSRQTKHTARQAQKHTRRAHRNTS